MLIERGMLVMPGSMVLRTGTLTGMDCVARCEVLARLREPYAWGDYIEALVLKAPEELPDGEYHVIFDGYEIHCRKSRDIWNLALAHRRIDEVAEDTIAERLMGASAHPSASESPERNTGWRAKVPV